MYIGRKSFRKWQLYWTTFSPWTCMATLFADFLAFSWLHLFTRTCLLWLWIIIPSAVSVGLYLFVIFCIAGNTSFFISWFIRNLLALTFCWVMWAGRVSTSRNRPVDTIKDPHQGKPKHSYWHKKARAGWKKSHLLCHGYKRGSPQCSELRVVRSLSSRETQRWRYFYCGNWCWRSGSFHSDR